MINLYKTLFLFEWFLGKIMIFLLKKVSVLNWEIFSLLSAKFLGIAGARIKGRWAIWNFLPFVIFTWAFFLVCCLPKECFSQERPEEQRGRTCSVGEKALMWSVSGGHRQGSSMIEKKKKKEKKLLLVTTGFLPSSDTGPFRAWGICSTSEHPNVFSPNVNMQICSTQ